VNQDGSQAQIRFIPRFPEERIVRQTLRGLTDFTHEAS
jgi:hypothetical protein